MSGRLLIRMLFLLALGVASPGCGHMAEKIGPVEFHCIERLGTAGIALEGTIENRSSYRVRLKRATLRLYYAGAFVGEAELRGEVNLEQRSLNPFTSRWRLRIEDPAAARLIEKRIEAQNYENITLDYCLRVRAGVVGKTFSREMMPLSEFLCTFGRQ